MAQDDDDIYFIPKKNTFKEDGPVEKYEVHPDNKRNEADQAKPADDSENTTEHSGQEKIPP